MWPQPVDFLAVDWNGTVVPFFGQDPYHQALATLRQWRASGTGLFIVSAAPQKVIEADVERVGLEVDGTIGCSTKGPTFRRLCQSHGRGLVVGDHPTDLRAALEAGMPFYQACLEGQHAIAGRSGSFQSWAEAALLVPVQP
ncbi:MAG: HAD family hydrolase [Planctomycetota bacterium]|nr:MAG: HAD family hydrolase [Planctomycetota bacterium]